MLTNCYQQVIKLCSIFFLSLGIGCAASAEKSAEEKYQRILRNYSDIYVGRFEPKPDDEEKVSNVDYPGGGYIVRSFLVENVIENSKKNRPEKLEVEIPIDLLNKDEVTYEEKVAARNKLEKKVMEITQNDNLFESQRSELSRLREKLRLERFLVHVLTLEQRLNYDFSLDPDVQYFFATNSRENDRLSLLKNLDKFIPLGKGHFIDDIDFLGRE